MSKLRDDMKLSDYLQHEAMKVRGTDNEYFVLLAQRAEGIEQERDELLEALKKLRDKMKWEANLNQGAGSGPSFDKELTLANSLLSRIQARGSTVKE